MVLAPYVVDIKYVDEMRACNWLQRKKLKDHGENDLGTEASLRFCDSAYWH